MKGEKMTAKRTSYKGNPLLELSNGNGGKYPFSFGLKKARLILDNIDEIKKFVEDQDQHARNVAADDFDQAQYQNQY